MRLIGFGKYKLILAVGVILTAFSLFGMPNADAANPTTINFQGKIVNANGTNVANGTYSIVFRIYNTAAPVTTTACSTTSTCLWQETQASVTVTNGVFQVALGSACALTSNACNNTAGGPINWNNDPALYLTFQFNGDSAGFMSPTIQITSVPFAFNADNLGGIAASGFVQNNSGSAQASTSFHISGTGAADTELQAPVFDVGTAGAALSIGTTNAGAITLGNTTNASYIFKSAASASALAVQNATGSDYVFRIDTSANQAVLGSSTLAGKLAVYNGSSDVTVQAAPATTAYAIFLPSSAGSANQCLMNSGTAGVLSWGYCGGGTSTSTVTLSPEYANAVLTPDSRSANTHVGTMSAGFCSGSSKLNIIPSPNPCGATDQHNYYSWTANATNDYDIWINWQAPSDFASFNSITYNGWTTSASDSSSLKVYLNGTSCGATATIATAGTWSTASPGFSSCTVAAGNGLTFDVDLKVGVNGEYARAGEIVIVYNRK